MTNVTLPSPAGEVSNLSARQARPHTGAHRAHVARILDEVDGARSADFWLDHSALCQAIGVAPRRFAFIPDAYRFNAVDHEIELYEVEVSSRLTREKIATLGDFWEWWDGEDAEWSPVLILVDRFGNRNRMDLMDAHYGAGWAA